MMPEIKPCKPLVDVPELFSAEDMAAITHDNVNRPAHYTKGAVECIAAIEASMTPESFRGYLKGCAMKYLWRYEDKGWIESLEKAQVYLGWLIKHLNENES